MFKNVYIVYNPKEIIESLNDTKTKPYVIKIKCLGCFETSFFEYNDLVLEKELLIVGERSYPIDLIEKITIRIDEKLNHNSIGFKTQIEYKVNPKYLKNFLSDGTKKLLNDLKLL